MESSSYFKREVFMLKLCGISLRGDENIFYKTYSFILLYVFNFPYPFLASGDLFKHDFDDALDAAIYIMGSYIGIIEMGMVIKNRKRLEKLLANIERDPFIPNFVRGGGKEEPIVRALVSFSAKQSKLFYSVMVFTIFPGAAYTLSKRIRSSDYHDWEFTYGPFTILNVTYSPNFEISWFYQNFAIMTIGFNVISITLIATGLLAHISIQFKVLQNFLQRIVQHSYLNMLKDMKNISIKSLLKNTSDDIDASIIPWCYLEKSLREAVFYHMNITDFANETIDIFSILIMSIYLIILGVLCLLVYDASILDMTDATTVLKVTMGMLCTFMQLFLISYWGEQVSTESEKLKFAAYQANFVGADIRFQKGLALIIKRSEKPIRIKAGKIIETSLVTFAWLIRTSYSSLMVLRKHNSGGK